MKTISAALEAHYAGRVTTAATCWKVTRTDAQVFGFTDHTADLVVAGVTYRANTGHDATAVESSGDLSVDNLDVEGFLDDTTIRESDLFAGLWDYARVEIFEVNYADLSMGTRKLRVGWLGEMVTRSRPRMFVAELRGLLYALQQTIGAVSTPGCRADVFDEECAPGGVMDSGLTLAGMSLTGQSVTGVTDRRTFAASGVSDGPWTGGKVEWLTGENAGLQMEIKTWTDGTKTFVLFLPMPHDIAASDTFNVRPGCLKRRTEDCAAIYDNVANFQGEPDVPGLDALTRGPI